jgi:metallo-beta-lactamase family protein
MKVSFHGAAREVTGSCHLVENGETRVLLDCGMIQGGKERHERNREPFPFRAARLRAVVLSHAHIDHSGRLPLLRRAGFRGPVLATPSTAHLCRILLADSGRIHEEDARWKIRRLKKRGADHDWVRPLFTEEEGIEAAEQLVPVEFDTPTEIDDGASVRLLKAGHILGAAVVDLTLRGPERTSRLTYSGDLGVKGARLLGQPNPVDGVDYLIVESTYGARNREETEDRTDRLHRIVERTVNRGGKVIIPAFAVGRTQEILARLNDLVEGGRLSGLPVYLDSPMAVAATRVFAGHPDAYSDRARDLLHAGDEPLEFPGLRMTTSVEESIEINRSSEPAVIISASGMCTAGRVKHHLKHNISDSRSTVLFVGYQANGTLGRLIRGGTSPVRIFGDWYPVRASVETIDGFSAHADRAELLEWFDSLGAVPRRTFVVHGEEESALAFAAKLRERSSSEVEVPRRDQRFVLD